ncbi:MAG: Rossmann-like and DUF2520 domain-containing protein, partial [Pyrinomonadaceae bacterium]
MVSVTIIGIGRVGGALALSLPPDSYAIENLIVHGGSDLEPIAQKLFPRPTVTTLADLSEVASDIVFITTQDANIVPAAKELVSKLRKSPVVFHTSGSYASSILDDLRAVDYKTGSLHPLVSISQAESGPSRFRNAFFCIEGQIEAVEVGKQIALDLGGQPFFIDTKFKTLYHAAAVTGCGHLVALFDAAVEMMSKCGLSRDESKNILMPLVTSTVQNLSEQNTAAALTGTFARADIETFKRHLTALN